MFDDFNLQIQCEEVYDENGFIDTDDYFAIQYYKRQRENATKSQRWQDDRYIHDFDDDYNDYFAEARADFYC